MFRILVSAAVLLSVGIVSSKLTIESHWINQYRFVCDKVQSEYYKSTSQLSNWADSCRRGARHEVKLCSKAQDQVNCIAQSLNQKMAAMGVSHLFISSPTESDEILFHLSYDTGLRVRLIEDLFIVTEVKANSVASQLDVRAGDIVLSRNNRELTYPADAKQSGKFRFKRDQSEFEIQITGTFFNEDTRPFFIKYSTSFGVLKLPSFEGDYKGIALFDSEEWKKITQEFSQVRHLVIDLRENYGGNFVGMLRAISPFFCSPTELGYIDQPRKTFGESYEFPNQYDAAFQVELLERYKKIVLKTYSGYGCYKGSVTVLVDHNTASVAEIMALSFRLRPHSRIMGHPTSGSVLVARRSELTALGSGYVLSLPIAEFVSNTGSDLEEEGLQPDELLYYEKEDALDGIDSWIETVRSHSPRS